jgi:hypothetical protein
MQSGTVYLHHFASPFKHARHYVGFTTQLDRRIEEHRTGQGTRLVAVVRDAGIPFVVARTWPRVDRHFERRLHRAKNTPKGCPICSGRKAWPFHPKRACRQSS